MVTNAGCRDKDLEFFKSEIANFPQDVHHYFFDGRGLIALQGPLAATVLQRVVKKDLTDLKFGQSMLLDSEFGNLYILRGGYTGEDGFEVS